MRIIRIAITVLMFTTIAASQAGCLIAAAAVGTGATVAYVRGDLDDTLDASPSQVADATVAAAKDLKLSLISHDTDDMNGKIVTRTADDTKIVIVLKGESDHETKVSIRAGTFGDNTLQQRMLDKIKSNLPPTATAIIKPTTASAVTADAKN